MRRGPSIREIGLVAVLLVLVVGSAVPLAGGNAVAGNASGAESDQPGARGPMIGPQPAYGVEFDPDDVLIEAALQPNGTGEIRIEYRVELDDENTTEAFERHREDIESNREEYREGFRTDMESTVDNAESATGREMAVANVSVDARREALGPESGVITYRFAWIGFAATNGTALEAGDALGGIYLDENTTLIIAWPEAYDRVSVAPTPGETRERSVVWSGGLYFTSSEPSLTVSSKEPRTTTGTPAIGGVSTSESILPSVGDRGAVVGFLGLVILVVLLGVAYRRSGGFRPGEERTGDGDDGSAGKKTEDSPSGDGGTGGDGVTNAGAAAGGAGSTGGDEELLSNEEQVLDALNDHGGRMKQQEIADELDWTDAKTSKVIGEMRENDAIETFRLGRENVVTLPDTGIGDNI
jgi:uncharacterized membrane protein